MMPSFANQYARRHYNREWLAIHLSRIENTTIAEQRRYLQIVPRDALIDDLRHAIRHDILRGRRPSNIIRAAYMVERCARLTDRRMLAGWKTEEPQHLHPVAAGRAE